MLLNISANRLFIIPCSVNPAKPGDLKEAFNICTFKDCVCYCNKFNSCLIYKFI